MAHDFDFLVPIIESIFSEEQNYIESIKEFIVAGDEVIFHRLPPLPHSSRLCAVVDEIGSANEWDSSLDRIVKFICYAYWQIRNAQVEHGNFMVVRLLGIISSGQWVVYPEREDQVFCYLTEAGFSAYEICRLYSANHSNPPFQNQASLSPQSVVSENSGLTSIERYIWKLSDSVLVDIFDALNSIQFLLEVVARERPSAAKLWLERQKAISGISSIDPVLMQSLIKGSSDFDNEALSYLQDGIGPTAAAMVVWQLFKVRPYIHHELITSYFNRPEIAAYNPLMTELCQWHPKLALQHLCEILKTGAYNQHPDTFQHCYRQGYRLAARNLNESGMDVFEALLANGESFPIAIAFQEIIAVTKPPVGKQVQHLLTRMFLAPDVISKGLILPMLRLLHENFPSVFLPTWWSLLDGTISIPSTHFYDFLSLGLPATPSNASAASALAVSAICKVLGDDCLPEAEARLNHKSVPARLAGVQLLQGLGSPAALALLLKRITSEENTKVRAAIHDALKFHGALPVPEKEDPANASKTLQAMDPHFSTALKKGKLPPGTWWRVDQSGLRSIGGCQLSASAADFLILEYSRRKIIETAPDTLQLVACLDKKSAADFALALLNAWLAEGQDSKHRWVLALAGTLGDSRIISTLLPWIPKWCEAARHKLAEYAAQGISLLGSNEALMVLDTLASRYRSKFRNVGAAAAAAFQSAAQARGISPDELGDLVVPSLDFNEDGQRRFEWDGGAALAELTMDLKLEWSDPDSEKSWKALPASASDAVKAEVKELGKLLRETGKAQALRLEQALVKQRRWPVASWQELYEKHPLLRAYATRLVWGVYTAEGTFQRAFRRYPNGILADAAGAMEELPEGEARIGLLHPLELDDAALTAWQAHLARFKVQPPFPQLDRPVERLEPNLHNRRVLSLTEGREISYGTFRSRAEKRGWGRGSVVDAGGISSYYKLFPGAGVEVSLETGDMYVGMDPMETLTLGPARFCTAGSIQRGSYVYDEPAENDPRLLTFGEVPPVVYSETVSDLKAIIAQKEAEEAS